MRSNLLAFLDRRDDRRAREIRRRLGPGGWLVSWSRDNGPGSKAGPWLVRASCRDWPETVERRGPSRSAALDRAVKALKRRIDVRASGPRPAGLGHSP